MPGERRSVGASPEDEASPGDEGREPAPPTASRQEAEEPPTLPPEIADRVRALRAEYEGREFTILAQDPWVVIGDGRAADVERHATGTVAWATTRLSEAYFGRGPDKLVEVWLFRDETSYYRNAKAIFGHEPDTPFGYYSYEAEALIMNIGSGGGTLVHEMVHPLMRANFPQCPSWFNEGLASLYEACSERDGEIVGLTNWRLPGLQAAIHAKTVPSIATLLATSEDGFYSEDPGSNYGQARYLCYWLQEQGVLRDFYRDFVDAAAADPTGIATLRKHVGTDDLHAFERDFNKFVLGLSYA